MDQQTVKCFQNPALRITKTLPTMQKLTLILILLFGFELFCQESDYRQVDESDIRVQYETIIDTVNIKKSRIALKWKMLEPEIKEKIRNNISEQKKDIESDTSNLTQIYYLGKKENVGLKINGIFLIPTSTLAEYYNESIYGDSIFKIKLGTIPRYSEIKDAELFFKDLHRSAKLQLDPKYSLIHIEVEHIEGLTEVLKREKEFEQNRKELKESGKVPKIPDTIEVLESEAVVIMHKIPKGKHSG